MIHSRLASITVLYAGFTTRALPLTSRSSGRIDAIRTIPAIPDISGTVEIEVVELEELEDVVVDVPTVTDSICAVYNKQSPFVVPTEAVADVSPDPTLVLTSAVVVSQ